MKEAKDLKRYKSQMRAKKRITGAEKRAKELLEKDGRDFKFQTIIGFYIVDFVIPDKMLIIEIDGGYHDSDYQKWYDKRRDIFLSKCAFKVHRLKNEDADKIVEVVSSYPYIVGWEKKLRHGLSWANQLKGRAIQEKRRVHKDQGKLL